MFKHAFKCFSASGRVAPFLANHTKTFKSEGDVGALAVSGHAQGLSEVFLGRFQVAILPTNFSQIMEGVGNLFRYIDMETAPQAPSISGWLCREMTRSEADTDAHIDIDTSTDTDKDTDIDAVFICVHI